MWSAFADRRPWATLVLALLLGPVVAMFYLGRARAGLIYLLIQFVFVPVILIGYPHSYIVARRQRGKRPTAWHGKWYGLILIMFVSALTIGEGMRTFLWQTFHFPSASMVPSLTTGDRFFVSKFAYGYSRYSFPYGIAWFEGRLLPREPERGDIMVFRHPQDIEVDYLKRIVGVPGDTIQMKDGVLHINGEPVKRERIQDYELRPGLFVPQYLETLPNGRAHRIVEQHGDNFRLDETPEYTVPPDQYFVMGDNRDNSADSRVFGFVPKNNLIGKLTVVFWNGRDGKLTWSTPD